MEQHSNPFILGCLERIPDPRKPYNQRHRFLDIVAITILASLCDADSWDEIEDWGIANEDWLRTFLELPNGIPSHDTFNRVFQRIDPNAFHQAFYEWVQMILSELNGVIAIDGKTVRRSREESSQTKPIHVVSAWATENSLVLGQVKVDDKSNEIKAIPMLLKELNLKGCTVTIDAMGTQREIVEKIREQEAEYILQVKENQPTLYGEISEYFEKEIFPKEKKGMLEKGTYYTEISGEHGRIERREYYVETEIGWMQDAKKVWKDLNGIGACRSIVEENGKKSSSVSYSIFSEGSLSAKEYGKRKRRHWGIENSLHWCLDIGFREDESRIRKDYAAENMNIVRHMCLNMLKQEKSSRMGIKRKRKKCGWDKDYLLKVLETLSPDMINNGE